MKASGGDGGTNTEMEQERNEQVNRVRAEGPPERPPHVAADQNGASGAHITAGGQERKKDPKAPAEPADDEQEHGGGGRFNRRLLIAAGVFATVVGVIAAEGLQSAGVKRAATAAPAAADNTGDAERHQAEVAELAAGAKTPAPMALPTPGTVAVMPIPKRQTPLAHEARTRSRYAQWAEDKYMRALEAPQMVGAFHSADTLEIGSGHEGQGGNTDTVATDGRSANVTLQPPASPYTVMTGSVIPAVLVSGIDSDLPGPILAQVSENVFDSATGQRLLIPQGSRLIGSYQSAMGYGQQRVAIAWRRLIFPDTSSMELPQMPGADQSGTNGFTDQVNNHYLATFATAAVTS
ncbi:MAG TPA: TrbI/VirB10 family protein, partial [Candidatus Binataceae bacterium]|nr:TrbI/VirB10 family protein [Candidatus Binataceae bacterium]